MMLKLRLPFYKRSCRINHLRFERFLFFIVNLDIDALSLWLHRVYSPYFCAKIL